MSGYVVRAVQGMRARLTWMITGTRWCGAAIADEDYEALVMAEGGLLGADWQRFIHRECVGVDEVVLRGKSAVSDAE